MMNYCLLAQWLVLYFLIARSAGMRTMLRASAFVLLSGLVVTCLMFGEFTGIISNNGNCRSLFSCCDFGLEFGPSFLSNSYPVWIGGNFPSNESWLAIYSWVAAALALFAAAGFVFWVLPERVEGIPAIPHCHHVRPRRARFTVWFALTGAVHASLLSFSTDERLNSVLGFNALFIGEIVAFPLHWLIYVLDSQYWTNFTLDSDIGHKALDKLFQNPVAKAIVRRNRSLPSSQRAPHIPYNHIAFDEKIASGAAGMVWSATVKGYPGRRAVKCIDHAEIVDSHIRALVTEVEVSWLFSAGCSHIVHCDGFSLAPPRLYITMELCEAGSLQDVLRKEEALVQQGLSSLPQSSLVRLAYQITGAVAHIHSLDFLHRDIKSLNVMCSRCEGDGQPSSCTHSLKAHLGDFGASVTMEDAQLEAPKHIGTIPWMAPEVIENWKVGVPEFVGFEGNHYHSPADCFSLAVILWECVTRQGPYAKAPLHPKRQRPMLDVDRYMLGDCIVDQKLRLRPTTDRCDDIPSNLRRIMEQGWCHDPAARSTASEMQAEILEAVAVLAAAERASMTPDTELPGLDDKLPHSTVELAHIDQHGGYVRHGASDSFSVISV